MSRIGSSKILLPEKVEVNFDEKSGEVTVSGPRGKESDIFLNGFHMHLKDNEVIVDIKKTFSNLGKEDAFQGLYNVLLKNMIEGVTKGFEKKLELIGVGYKAAMLSDTVLEIDLGFSHKVIFILPSEVKCKVQAEKGKNIIISLTGNNKYLVGQMTAKIKSLRPVEPYKGKGFRNFGEVIKLKVGKTATAKK